MSWSSGAEPAAPIGDETFEVIEPTLWLAPVDGLEDGHINIPMGLRAEVYVSVGGAFDFDWGDLGWNFIRDIAFVPTDDGDELAVASRFQTCFFRSIIDPNVWRHVFRQRMKTDPRP